MELMAMPVKEFVAELASLSPAPGGGTIAATNGAFAAALGAMVCKLTLRKPKEEKATERLAGISDVLEESARRFLVYADKDTEAFNEVMAAFALPKNSSEELEARKAAIALANIGATEVPMATATLAVEVCEKLAGIVVYANSNVLSDCGVALQCAKAAACGAFMNVEINLPGIKDEAVAQEFAEKLSALKERLEAVFSAANQVFTSRFYA